VRVLEVTEQIYYRWRNQCWGLKADDAKQLKELERENQLVGASDMDEEVLQIFGWEIDWVTLAAQWNN